jgi:hypothetical protein
VVYDVGNLSAVIKDGEQIDFCRKHTIFQAQVNGRWIKIASPLNQAGNLFYLKFNIFEDLSFRVFNLYFPVSF